MVATFFWSYFNGCNIFFRAKEEVLVRSDGFSRCLGEVDGVRNIFIGFDFNWRKNVRFSAYRQVFADVCDFAQFSYQQRQNPLFSRICEQRRSGLILALPGSVPRSFSLVLARSSLVSSLGFAFFGEKVRLE